MTRVMRQVFVAAAVMAVATAAAAQSGRPRATVTPVVTDVTATPGQTVSLALAVSMPADVHVQAHKPDDPLLVPTVLNVEVPEGLALGTISYPQPVPFAQQGRPTPLLVLGPTFEIGVTVTVAHDAPPGTQSVPVVLRYQACNEKLCFPPARATAAWTVAVRK